MVPTPESAQDLSAYVRRYWINLFLGNLTVLSVIENVVVNLGITGAWLGIPDLAWHWIVLGLAVATALNAMLSHTPPITRPPTPKVLAVENAVQAMRKAT